MVGTLGYTAPEILELRGGAGPRSDIYSVCVVLYEMLTGRRYESPSSGRAQTIERGEFSPALGPIADVLRRGTAREPSERMWSMADLVRTLEIVRAGLLGARRRWQLGVVALLGVLSTAVITGLALRYPVDGPPVEVITRQVAPPTPSPEPEAGPVFRPGRVEAAPEPEPKASPSDPPDDAASPSKPVELTDSKVRARLLTRKNRLAKCESPLLVLDLTITAGRLALAAVNGMSEGDELHTCVRDTLRGLTFPAASAPKKCTVTIDLGAEVKG